MVLSEALGLGLTLPRAGQGSFELYGLALVGLLIILIGVGLVVRQRRS
jgi:hypothetical protein